MSRVIRIATLVLCLALLGGGVASASTLADLRAPSLWNTILDGWISLFSPYGAGVDPLGQDDSDPPATGHFNEDPVPLSNPYGPGHDPFGKDDSESPTESGPAGEGFSGPDWEPSGTP